MSPAERRRSITVRVLREGQEEPRDDWAGTTMGERMEAVWQLTRLCMEWNRSETGEPRLRRSVVRVLRGGR